ncbi:uncharacterized protein LOC143040963 [Oratosquilla oratoria]|uniref:uncharacterized protein LOC143040963 n=1 Tax=Oratosquilla oratoria TaxID=337810 RepID=UPI003F75E657
MPPKHRSNYQPRYHSKPYVGQDHTTYLAAAWDTTYLEAVWDTTYLEAASRINKQNQQAQDPRAGALWNLPSATKPINSKLAVSPTHRKRTKAHKPSTSLCDQPSESGQKLTSHQLRCATNPAKADKSSQAISLAV